MDKSAAATPRGTGGMQVQHARTMMRIDKRTRMCMPDSRTSGSLDIPPSLCQCRQVLSNLSELAAAAAMPMQGKVGAVAI